MNLKMIKQELFPSIFGATRKMFSKHFWPVLKERIRHFVAPKYELPVPINTAEGFTLYYGDEVISYWCFFIEHQIWHPFWVNKVKSATCPVILDIGANHGLFSELIRHLNKRAHVICFEPQAILCNYLKKVRQFECYGIALSNYNGTGMMHLNTLGSLTSPVASLLANCPSDTRIGEVKVEKLDSFVSAYPIKLDPLLIKIDAEYCDDLVVEGGLHTCGATPLIIVEAWDKNMLHRICRKLPRHDYLQLTTIDYLFYLKG